MTLLYQSDRFLEHQTGAHPECAARLEAVAARLAETGLLAACRRPEWAPVSDARLAHVHAPDYAETVARFAAAGGGRIEGDTLVSPASSDVARLAAGAVCDAVERVVAGEATRALCLVRPPGHHALQAAAMGFCLFNNVALAARMATAELGLERVLIVDFDVHHGNGTQDAFWDDPQVAFLSIHRWPFYPGTGRAEETGGSHGAGTIVNLPIEFGTPLATYHDRFATELEALADRFRPELILVSAGFDAHREDPIGSLGLESEDFARLTAEILDIAQAHAGGRVVSVLEGGYNPKRLAESVQRHLETLRRDEADGTA